MPKSSISVNDVAAVVRAQLGDKLPRDVTLGPETTLEEVGLSSLDVTEVFFAIEELAGRELDPVPASDAKRVGELLEMVNAQLGERVEAVG